MYMYVCINKYDIHIIMSDESSSSTNTTNETSMYVSDMIQVVNGKNLAIRKIRREREASDLSIIPPPSKRRQVEEEDGASATASASAGTSACEKSTTKKISKRKKLELLETLEQLKEEVKRDNDQHRERVKKIVGLWYRYENSLNRLANATDLNAEKDKGMLFLR